MKFNPCKHIFFGKFGFSIKLFILLLIIISSLIISCSDSINENDASNFALSDTLSLNYREKLKNVNENISITFDDLLFDGRCPVDMRCVWEGDAEASFNFIKDNVSYKFTLHTAGNYYRKDTALVGYNIKLIDLVPYPHSKIQYHQSDYLAKIVIE